MNTLHSLSDSEILTRTEKLASEERRIHAELLRFLREVDRRRLYLDLGYDSLYRYCVKHLKLSEGSASRRISATKLIRDLPDPESALKSVEQGTVNLSTLSQTQSFIKAEKRERDKEYSSEKKEELVLAIQGRSQKECEVLFASISPSAIPKEKERVLTKTQTEVKFVMGSELREKLEKIRSLLSHTNPDPTYAELLDQMAEIVLKKIDPARKPDRPVAHGNTAAVSEEEPRNASSTYVPQAIRREVWKRDGGACTYTDPSSKRRCGSRFQVQLDHRIPVGLGGTSTLGNLRCLCRKHNLNAAVKAYGPRKMSPYWKRTP